MTPGPRNLSLPILASLHIAEPCPLADEAWQPGQRTRHCAECDLDVHNFSALTSHDAAALVTHSRETGTRLCASYEHDAAGNLITLDSPARQQSAHSNRPRILMRLLAAFGVISSPIALAACATRTGGKVAPGTVRLGGSVAAQPLDPSPSDPPPQQHQ